MLVSEIFFIDIGTMLVLSHSIDSYACT